MVQNDLHYPFSNEYEYETYIETIDFDKEAEVDIKNGNGFLISNYKGIKKDIKDPDSIYSPRFGQSLQDTNTFMIRYKCKCGELKGRIHRGLRCPKCGTRVDLITDSLDIFGWMRINQPYFIIAPAFYKKIGAFFGKGVTSNPKEPRTKLDNIIDYSISKDINGHEVPLSDNEKPKNEPFFGIGIIEFKNRFKEIMDYYYKISSSASKKDKYQDIMENIDKIFIHNIPVFSTILRPIDINGDVMSYEKTNPIYTMMNHLRTRVNRNKSKFDRDVKSKNITLYKLQMQFMLLYNEQEACLSGKRGDIRSLMGARYNFSSRDVIVQNPDLEIDEITLSTVALVKLLEPRIKNILHRLYNISYSEAHKIWDESKSDPTDFMKSIIQSIIDSEKEKGRPGIPIIINRNPTIGLGSILQMFCIGFTDTYTMQVPLQPLPLLKADFDGDVLNVLLIINEVFYEYANKTFNPKNCFYISRNDGYFNIAVSMQRDTIININTLARMGRENYSKEELDKLRKLSSSRAW